MDFSSLDFLVYSLHKTFTQIYILDFNSIFDI